MSGDGEENFADKLDRMLFDEEFDLEDDEDRELLEFAGELKGLMPPVEADRSFKSSLRAELIVMANQRAGRQSTPGTARAKSAMPGGFPWWRRPSSALASVFSVLIIIAAIAIYQHFQVPEDAIPVVNPTQVAQASPSPEGQAAAPLAAESSAETATGDAGVASVPQSTPAASDQKLGVAAEFGPLPEISPMTDLPAYGLGGGAAGAQPVKLPEFPFPAKLINRYVLDGTLPADLPGEAAVYGLEAVVDPQAEAEAVAAILGFSGPAEIIDVPPYAGTGSAGEKQYMWHDGTADLSYRPSEGSLSYLLLDQANPSGDVVVTGESGAVAAARGFLESKGILSPSMEVESVTEITPSAGTEGEVVASPRMWQVHFQKEIAGAVIRGDMADAVVNDRGIVFNFSLTSRDITGESSYPLRPVEEAWQSVADGKALWIRTMPLPDDGEVRTAKVTGVSIAYYELLPGKQQDYIQPLYEFSGVVNGPEGQEYPVLIYATAVATDFLVR